MNVDGEPAHFLADPNMTPETWAALESLVRAARVELDKMPLYTCPKCGKERARAEGRMCTSCKIAELWE